MTKPTDAEIKKLYLEETGFDLDESPAALLDFVRAVLAKWGTPPAGEGAPECTCSAKDMPFGTCCKVRSAFERWYDEQNDGRLQPFDVFKGGWIERHRLSSTPQPTQAGAVPLTHDEALDAFCHTPGIHQFVQAFMAGVRFAEQHHGIKGGQHGADT